MRYSGWFVIFIFLRSTVDGLKDDDGSHLMQKASEPSSCCSVLQHSLPGKIFTTNSNLYEESLESYWSVQEQEVRPNCIVRPENRDDVALAVKTLAAEGCQFAVRSGGPWAGAANIENGVTIDLSNLDRVDIAEDRSTVTIGPGNTWHRVYSRIVPEGLAVGGGRVASVGVGGLTLGGGVSFFSPRHGFVCDTVKRFEVVLASGEIVDVTQTSHHDLWLALKGGSNNFGIVTAFQLEAIEQGDFWGGFIGYTETTFDAQFAAFEKLTGDPNYDSYAALIANFVWNKTSQSWYGANNFEYTRPEANPAVFKDFTSLPSTFSTMRISNLTDFAVELSASNPSGRRQLFLTGTYKNNAAMMKSIFAIANDTVRDLNTVVGLAYSLSFQPEPVVLLQKAEQAGGNSLGLDASDGPLFNFLLTVTWDSTFDDELVDQKARELYVRSEAVANDLGVQNRYLYLNYAAAWQDPIAGYGPDVKTRLQATSRKYDADGVFQKQVPGGFKLFP